MERGLYIAASGMLAELTRQDQIANDLANAATAGYKADRASQRSFDETLALVDRSSGAAIGTLGTGAQIARQVTDLRPQALRQTDEPLDMAIQGDGFFAVRSEQGIRFTRNGAFTAAPDGRLVDQLGNAVLGPDRQPVRVGAEGTVKPSDVGVFNVPNARKAGDSLFTGTSSGRPGGTVVTGSLETSGIDATRTMVDMIASLRAFEAGQRVIQTIDTTLGAAASQVGSIR